MKKTKINLFGLFAAFIAVAVQTPHTYYLFQSVTHFTGEFAKIHALAVAVVIDLSILYYTIKNKKAVALAFAVFMYVVNLLYVWDYTGEQFITGLLFALMIPIAVYFYKGEIIETAEPKPQQRKPTTTTPKRERLNKMIELKQQGRNNQEIASILGVDISTVYRNLNRAGI